MRAHRSGNPDAFQYSPVYNGMAAWQLYHGDGFSGSAKFKFNRWMPVILKVAGNRAELYIDDPDTPVLVMDHLKQAVKPGKIGLKALPFSPGYFAGFKVRPMPAGEVVLKSKPKPVVETPPGTVMKWRLTKFWTLGIIKR